MVGVATVTVYLTEKSLSEGALRGGLPALVVGGAVLAILAFIGGAACALVFFALERGPALVLGAATVALAVSNSAAAQLFQKYAELPLAMITVLALVSLWTSGRVVRLWPLVMLAVLQAVMTAGLVVLPILRG